MHPVELLGQTGSQEDKAPFIIFAPGWDPRAGPTGAWKHIIFYHLIEGSFAPIVQNWFAFADAYRPVWTALVDGIYYPGQFLESQLLGTVQALEGLHRRDFEGVYISSEDFEEVRKAVVGAIPQGTDPALRQALKEKLTWGNEFSLRKRLRQLLASIPQSLADAVGRKKIQQLPDELTETRNALAHCVDPPKQAPDMWLFHLTMQSRLLLKLLVLRKIGVPDDVIAKAITF